MRDLVGVTIDSTDDFPSDEVDHAFHPSGLVPAARISPEATPQSHPRWHRAKLKQVANFLLAGFAFDMTDAHNPTDEPTENEPAAHEEQPAEKQGGFKAGPFAIVALLVVIFAFIQVQRKIFNRPANSENGPQSLSTEEAVGLTIQVAGEKPTPLFEVPWSPGMTVRDLMQTAERAGNLTFEEVGEDDGAMLVAISGTKNEGGSPDSFNWTFRVNEKMGDKSFAIYELQKGDMVSWKFGPYE